MAITYNGGVVSPCISANLVEELNGEYTLDFEVPFTDEMKNGLKHDSTFSVNGQSFDVGSITRSMDGNGNRLIKVEADHISYRLNREEYDVEPYKEEVDEDGNVISNNGGFKPMYNMSAGYIFSQILQGTPFSAGCSIGGYFSFSIGGKTSRRQMVLDFVEQIRGEIKFNNYSMEIAKHIGSTVNKQARVGYNILSLSETIDKRTRPDEDDDNVKKPYVVNYECEIIDNIDDGYDQYHVGDNITIVDTKLGLNTTQRVVSITSYPNDPTAPSKISLGDINRRRFEEQNDTWPTKQDEEWLDDWLDNKDLKDKGGGGGGGGGGDPGEGGEVPEHSHSFIVNSTETQKVETTPTTIEITSVGTKYTLDLTGGENGMPIVKGDFENKLKFGLVPMIRKAYQDEQGQTQVASILSTSPEGIKIRTGTESDEFLLNIGKFNKDLEDGNLLVAKEVTDDQGAKKKEIRLGSIEKIIFRETDENGKDKEKSSVAVETDRIRFKVGDEDYSLVLDAAAPGTALQALVGPNNLKVLGFDTVPMIAYIEYTQKDDGTYTADPKTVVQCGPTQIGFKQLNNVWYLDLADGVEGSLLVAEPATNSIKFKGQNNLNFKGNIVIVPALPPVDSAEEDTLYIVYGTT
jgi:hypothetical protein